ncbi:unnamed protein product [Dimorphilus gyrociliatus]|uniref:Uncharacterized protein n=1 Tax=Dimorphilus gyrociliatus TaxID=2664684 RepID=A0A7I8WBC9_9ANNE|nr:unnamed protein product [Dimorphilus gyrociliatus]
MPRKKQIKTVAKCANPPNQLENLNQQANMIDSAAFEQKLDDQRRTFEDKLDEQSRKIEESNAQNLATLETKFESKLEANLKQIVQIVNSIKLNSHQEIPLNSGYVPELEHLSTVEEQNGGNSQVRNISNPIQEAESSSKQLDPRIENLRNKKVTPSEMFSGTNFQDFRRNAIVPLLESDISELEKRQILKRWTMEGTVCHEYYDLANRKFDSGNFVQCVQKLDYVYTDISSQGCNLVQQILNKRDPFQHRILSYWVEFRTLLTLLDMPNSENRLKFERLRQFSKRLPHESQSLVTQYINEYYDDFDSIVIKLGQYISKVANGIEDGIYIPENTETRVVASSMTKDDGKFMRQTSPSFSPNRKPLKHVQIQNKDRTTPPKNDGRCMCAENHICLAYCPIYINLDVKGRQRMVRLLHRRQNCLRSGHTSEKCSSRYSCKKCIKLIIRHYIIKRQPPQRQYLLSTIIYQRESKKE